MLNSMEHISIEDFQKMCSLAKFIEQLKHHMCELPKTCMECPAKSCDIGNGIFFDRCLINTDTYTGDFWFGHHKTRPKWCPAVRYWEGKNGL